MRHRTEHTQSDQAGCEEGRAGDPGEPPHQEQVACLASNASAQGPGNEPHPEEQARPPLLECEPGIVVLDHRVGLSAALALEEVRDAGAPAGQPVTERVVADDLEELLVDAARDAFRDHGRVRQAREALKTDVAADHPDHQPQGNGPAETLQKANASREGRSQENQGRDDCVHACSGHGDAEQRRDDGDAEGRVPVTCAVIPDPAAYQQGQGQHDRPCIRMSTRKRGRNSKGRSVLEHRALEDDLGQLVAREELVDAEHELGSRQSGRSDIEHGQELREVVEIVLRQPRAQQQKGQKEDVRTPSHQLHEWRVAG